MPSEEKAEDDGLCMHLDRVSIHGNQLGDSAVLPVYEWNCLSFPPIYSEFFWLQVTEATIHTCSRLKKKKKRKEKEKDEGNRGKKREKEVGKKKEGRNLIQLKNPEFSQI